MKTFKEFIKEEMNTGEVPLTQEGPYKIKGFKTPIFRRKKPFNKQGCFEDKKVTTSDHQGHTSI